MIFKKVLMELNGVPIEDTYCEAFDGIFTRFIVTADDRMLSRAELGLGLPSVIVGRTEGGIETWLSKEETPDGRKGFVGQIWGMYTGDLDRDASKFYKELSIRIRQGILVVPTTKLFNALDSDRKLDMMDGVGCCGDVYQEVVDYNGREMISVPIMMGEDFMIERELGYDIAISGGNVWFLCDGFESAIKAGESAVEAVLGVKGAITPFDVCSAGSKPPYEGQPNVEVIGPSTNNRFCPTLRGKISDSMVPAGVRSIPEIVINAVDLDTLKKAMKAAITAGSKVSGVLGITSGNYGGMLGKHAVSLKDVI